MNCCNAALSRHGRRSTRVALGVTLTALAGGCGNAVVAGSPAAPASDLPGTTVTQSSAPAAVRPASLDVTGLDPCDVIPDDVLASIGSSPARVGSDQTGATEFGCSYRDINSPDGTGVFLNSGESYEEFGRPAGGVIVTPIQVSGYRAFSVQKPSRAACTVGVDIADTQSLSTTSTGSFSAPVPPLCDRAAEFAAAAITALTQK